MLTDEQEKELSRISNETVYGLYKKLKELGVSAYCKLVIDVTVADPESGKDVKSFKTRIDLNSPFMAAIGKKREEPSPEEPR